MTNKEVKNLVHKTLKPKDWGQKVSLEYDTSAVLLASGLIGAFPEKIAKALELPLKFVNNVAKNARKNGIWLRNGKVHAEWSDKKNGAIALACDTCVCLGLLQRSK